MTWRHSFPCFPKFGAPSPPSLAHRASGLAMRRTSPFLLPASSSCRLGRALCPSARNACLSRRIGAGPAWHRRRWEHLEGECCWCTRLTCHPPVPRRTTWRRVRSAAVGSRRSRRRRSPRLSRPTHHSRQRAPNQRQRPLRPRNRASRTTGRSLPGVVRRADNGATPRVGRVVARISGRDAGNAVGGT